MTGRARAGTVYLVGSGPGAEALVTLRCRELVASADVLVYDRLIPSYLVDLVPDGCERIDAGKTAGDHTIAQPDINELLVAHASSGKSVVRLKGGDPYLFGRGGEEAARCHDAGVPFEVVSGVTSALSVPASAGIPVTHRGVSQHVTIVTASTGPTGDGDPDYAWLAHSGGTVVLLMGLRRLAHIAASLVAHGAPADRPVAVISRGTTPEQRTVTGTLLDIAERVDAARLAAPAIVVVGDVVRLRDELDWFERRPLFGRTITVTRARAQASGLVAALTELGAQVIETPTVRTEPLADGPLDDAVARLSEYDFCVFTSRNGVDRFMQRVQAVGRDVRSLAGVTVAVVGGGTADACRAYGLVPDVLPDPGQFTSLGLLERLGREPLYGSRVLVVRAEVGEERFITGLADHGAHVDVVHAYRTIIDVPDAATVQAALTADVVTFTSASTVRNFDRLIPAGVAKPAAITIGPVTSIAARDHGYEVLAESDVPGVPGLVSCLLDHFAAEPALMKDHH